MTETPNPEHRGHRHDHRRDAPHPPRRDLDRVQPRRAPDQPAGRGRLARRHPRGVGHRRLRGLRDRRRSTRPRARATTSTRSCCSTPRSPRAPCSSGRMAVEAAYGRERGPERQRPAHPRRRPDRRRRPARRRGRPAAAAPAGPRAGVRARPVARPGARRRAARRRTRGSSWSRRPAATAYTCARTSSSSSAEAVTSRRPDDDLDPDGPERPEGRIGVTGPARSSVFALLGLARRLVGATAGVPDGLPRARGLRPDDRAALVRGRGGRAARRTRPGGWYAVTASRCRPTRRSTGSCSARRARSPARCSPGATSATRWRSSGWASPASDGRMWRSLLAALGGVALCRPRCCSSTRVACRPPTTSDLRCGHGSRTRSSDPSVVSAVSG